MADFCLLASLPAELLQDTIERLDKSHLGQLSLASQWCYQIATPLIWRDLELTDCSTQQEEGLDQHDDTPWLKKLLILIRNPRLGPYVQTLTHRCHLPPPGIFNELVATPFNGATLSPDPRTTELIRLASRCMTRVHTLRIIMGHPAANDALIRCFFAADRKRENPIRRLWLESCRVDLAYAVKLPGNPMGLPSKLSYEGLESVRFRRLPLCPVHHMYSTESVLSWVHCRSAQLYGKLQDGTGGYYDCSVDTVITELPFPLHGRYRLYIQNEQYRDFETKKRLLGMTRKWDDRIYESLAEQVALPWHDDGFDVEGGYEQRERMACMPHVISGAFDADGRPKESRKDALYHYWGVQDTRAESCEQTTDDSDVMQTHTARLQTSWPGAAQAYSAYSATEWRQLSLHDLGSDFNVRLGDGRPEPTLAAEDVPPTSAEIGISILATSCASLTSVCFDWVFADVSNAKFPGAQVDWHRFYAEFFALRFPHLKAFQFRNSVDEHTVTPEGLYLLDAAQVHIPPCPTYGTVATQVRADLQLASLSFMEHHRNLQCLCWPMESFFSPYTPTGDLADRIDAVINNLSRTLTHLRVQTIFRGQGEPFTDDGPMTDILARSSRRAFIERFAARMTKLESIKMEGGIPRDERREVIRALHRCPLSKVVMIGVTFAIGNTWGDQAQDLQQGAVDLNVADLEAEDKPATFDLGSRAPPTVPDDFVFNATYGWPPQQPLLHTLASHHAATARQLKFCGYQGAPILFSPTPITTPLLNALKSFTHLESLILSTWLETTFEGSPRDADIINYWLAPRSPTTTALVRSSNSPGDEESTWETALRTRYAPAALAGEIVRLIGPFLDDGVKGRKDGVHVRASICIGEAGGIFDVDMRVGRRWAEGEDGGWEDYCLGFEGPREEGERGRRVGKLVGREWF